MLLINNPWKVKSAEIARSKKKNKHKDLIKNNMMLKTAIIQGTRDQIMYCILEEQTITCCFQDGHTDNCVSSLGGGYSYPINYHHSG